MASVEDYPYTFIGARYVPIFDNEQWDQNKSYEPLTVVQTSNLDSWTSRQFVPSGIPISNTDYWVHTGNYNYQWEELISAKYLKYFNTVNDMKNSTNINEGDVCLTLGYYYVNDGGGAYYIIGNSSPNEIDIITCANNTASLIINQRDIKSSQFGCRANNDCTANFMRMFEIAENHSIININTYRPLINTQIIINSSFLTINGDDNPYNYISCNANINNTVFLFNGHCYNINNLNFRSTAGDVLSTLSYPNLNAIKLIGDNVGESWEDMDSVINNCGFTYFYTCAIAYGKNIQFLYCTFSNSPLGVEFFTYKNNVLATQARNLTVKNCTFHGGDPSFVQNKTATNDINYFGVRCLQVAREINIIGNQINSDFCGIFYYGVAQGLNLINNRNETHTGRAMLARLTGTYGGIGDDRFTGVIDGNVFYHNPTSFEDTFSIVDRYPIICYADHVVISNNKFFGYYAFILFGNTNNEIINNTCVLNDNTSYSVLQSSSTAVSGRRTVNFIGNIIKMYSDATLPSITLFNNVIVTDYNPAVNTCNSIQSNITV